MSKDLEYIYINLDDTGNIPQKNQKHIVNGKNDIAHEDDDIFIDASHFKNDDIPDDISAEASCMDEAADVDEVDEPDDEEAASPGKKSRRGRIILEIISYVAIIAAAFILATLTNRYLIVNARIPSGSMIPTITEGNRIIGNRLAYINSDPKRGDVVVFYYPDDETQKYIKRIIGLPGETVYIEHGTVYINGQPLDESDYLTVETSGVSGPFTVPENCYFMMGDNRNSSWDSRFWNNTFVSKDKIIAKAMFCYFPTIHLIK